MPRPSLKDQRSEEILDAYLTCVARFGLEGATQERIARAAGVKRPLLRHYLGNKDQMIAALTDHVVASFADATDGLAAVLGTTSAPSELVEILFAKDAANDPRLMLAHQALVTAVSDHQEMQRPLLDSMERFLNVIKAMLERTAPNACPVLIRAATQGIAASYVSLDALSPLNPPIEWRQDLKQAAMLLATRLEDTA